MLNILRSYRKCEKWELYSKDLLPEIWKYLRCSISRFTYYCPIGCFSEVSLDYLYKLHNLHNDYSIKPEETIEESKFSLGKKEKLIPILDNKKKKKKNSNSIIKT